MSAGEQQVSAQDAQQKYWEAFYESQVSRDVPVEPSPFARWVHDQLAPAQPILEFGFGTARDSLWFARQGHPVFGFDFAESAVENARSNAAAQLDEGTEAAFARLDLDDDDAVRQVDAARPSWSQGPAMYGRFLIHSLDELARSHFFDAAAQVLAEGGELYVEFRTGLDRDAEHVFGNDHYRVYLEPETVTAEIEARRGRVTHAEAAHGLAVYKTEDPHVARIVARWTP